MKKQLSLLLIVGVLSSQSEVIFGQINTDLINSLTLTESIAIVPCTLENGTSTDCYQLKFYANYVNDDGPFCPETINDIGGLAIYEPGMAGTNVGLAALDAQLLNLIEADGFDIVQPNGDVNINIPGAGGGPPEPGTSYCLQANKDDDLELVYLIPISPMNLTNPNVIQPVEQLGFSLNGIPFKGPPPGVIGGPMGQGTDVLMPALDACGGHHDPGGYYHWHLIANSTNELLNDLDITAVSCAGYAQNPSSMMGYAMDGYPIYGQFESGTTLPSGLDQCNGHFSSTTEYPQGVYHYHALQGSAPNIPPCLTGASANNNFTYSFHVNPLEVSDIGNQGNSSLAPNPSAGRLVIVRTTAQQIELFDNLGKKINEKIIYKTDTGFEINTIALAEGIYHVVIIDGASRYSSKLVITK